MSVCFLSNWGVEYKENHIFSIYEPFQDAVVVVYLKCRLKFLTIQAEWFVPSTWRPNLLNTKE